VIVAPKPGERAISSPLTIAGTAPAGTSVVVTLVVEPRPNAPDVTFEPVTVAVSDSGAWRVRIPLPSAVLQDRPRRLTITVVAVAQDGGARSRAASTVVVVGAGSIERP
jgi:hypothetical protein